MDRDRISEATVRLLDTFLSRYPDAQANELLREIVAEFMWEALLNAQEHAYSSETNPSRRRVWVAGAIVPGELVQPLYDPVGFKTPHDEKTWFGRHMDRGIEQFLELAVVDIGMSIPTSLGSVFDKRSGKTFAKGPRYRDKRRRHDAVIEWALSPFGSRKSAREYPSSISAHAWRGLYRVLYRVGRVQGTLVARSGIGAFGAAVLDGRHVELRWEDHKDNDESKPWPCTSLVLRLPLPLPLRPSASEGANTLSAVECTPTRWIFVPPQAREKLDPMNEHNANQALGEYARFVKESITTTLERQHRALDATRSASEQLALIVHPAVTISTPDVATEYPRVGHTDSLSPVLKENNQAQELIEILAQSIIGEHAFPGFIPVHIFLDVSRGAIRLAKRMFPMVLKRIEATAGAAVPTPRVAGLADPFDGTIDWFLCVEGDSAEADLAVEGRITIPISRPSPQWWRTLVSHLGFIEDSEPDPGRVSVRTASASESTTEPIVRRSLRNPLPGGVARQTLDEALNKLMMSLGEYNNGNVRRWFWKREEGHNEALRTSSGKLVRQYVAPYPLCAGEPVIAKVFAGALYFLLTKKLGFIDDDTITVMLDSGGSSYLVAKLLHQHLRRSLTLRIVHPQEAVDLSSSDKNLIAFADVIHTGTQIGDGLAQLRSRVPVRAVVTCLDLRADPAPSTWEEPVYSIVTWRFPRPLKEPLGGNFKIYAVDAITKQILDGGTLRAAKAYHSLLWRSPAEPERDLFTEDEINLLRAPGRFRYGFQGFGGRTHIVRYDTKALVADVTLLHLVASCVVRSLLDAGTLRQDEDIVLFARDESFLWFEVRKLSIAIAQKLRAAKSSWAGRVFASPIITTKHAGGQTVRYHLMAQLNPMELLEGQETGARSGQQLVLQLDSMRARPPMPLGSDFRAVYVEQAAITGRAIREFLLAMTEMTTPPRGVHLVPLVNKLSPSEEALLHRVSSLTRTDINVPALPRVSPEREAQPNIFVSIRSLLQLRIRSYQTFEHSTLFRQLDRVIRQAKQHIVPAVRDWASHVQRLRLDPLTGGRAQGALNLCEQFPACAVESEACTVSVDVIYFRHLLGLYQQGLPVLDELLLCFRRLVESGSGDPTLLVVFALEPEFLGDPMLAPFSWDVAQLALRVVRDGREVGLRSNALWVLFLQERLFVTEAKEIARTCALDPALSAQWLALLTSIEKGSEKRVAVQSAAEAFSKAPLEDERQRKQWPDIRAHLKAELDSPHWDPPKDQDDARQRVYILLREARFHHGRGFGSWWEISQVMDLLRERPDHMLLATELPEHRWDDLRDFVLRVMKPAVDGIAFLLRQTPGVPREDLLTSPSDAIRAIDAAKRCTSETIARECGSEVLLEAWQDLLRATFQDSADALLSERRECILNNAAARSLSKLDYFIPLVVIEPVALLLHSLGDALSDERLCRLTITMCGDLLRDATDTISNHIDFWRARWLVEGAVPVFWNEPDALRQCYAIFAQNISIHGAPGGGLSVNCIISMNNFEVRIANQSRYVDDSTHVAVSGPNEINKRGRERGLQHVHVLTNRLKGVLVPPEVRNGEFQLIHKIPTRRLRLPSPGQR
jgi:hypothetical protein